MSCVCILTPVVIASWPAFSAVVVAAATSLGYTVAEKAVEKIVRSDVGVKSSNQIKLEIAQSELVTEQIGRDQHISVTRDGVTVTFSRDARGKAALCVSGDGHSEVALRTLGEELSQKVVQKFVYQRLMDELKARQFLIVEEEVGVDQTIRLKVRHWEN